MTIVDAIYLITYLYLAGPFPVAPFPDPGPDPTEDFINCDCAPGISEEAVSWYLDGDNDGHGDPNNALVACDQPAGYVDLDDDCDDTRPSVHPFGIELCNGIDDDCNGVTDEPAAADAPTWYRDFDGDGSGDALATVVACEQPDEFVSSNDDCNDTTGYIRPGATELCNGIDDDCDGDTDEPDAADALTWYLDADGDGHGNNDNPRPSCFQPNGFVASNDDCNDGDGSVNPTATEICNAKDDDCDGETDEPDAVDALTWYRGFDGDGNGDALVTQLACTQPDGYVTTSDRLQRRCGRGRCTG